MMAFYLRWPFILVVSVIFWPLGLWLLGIRIARDMRLRLKVGQWLLNAGVLLLLVGGLVVLSALFGTDDDPGGRIVLITVGSVLGAVPGVVLIWRGYFLRARSRKIGQYLELITEQGLSSVSAISASLNTSPDLVISELARLIRDGYLCGYYLNRDSYTIDRVSSESASNEGQTRELRAWTCEACAGVNSRYVKSGEPPICEYCGTAQRG